MAEQHVDDDSSLNDDDLDQVSGGVVVHDARLKSQEQADKLRSQEEVEKLGARESEVKLS